MKGLHLFLADAFIFVLDAIPHIYYERYQEKQDDPGYHPPYASQYLFL